MGTRLDPLEYLERSDKWYLGGGRGVIFAPAFPRYLEAPGFWDEAYYADVRLERLFTVLLLGEDERPIALRRDSRRWTPDALTHTFSAADGLRIREDKLVTPAGTLVSRITVLNDGKRARSLHLVLWSLQERAPFGPGAAATSAEDTALEDGALVFAHTVSYGDTPYNDRPAEVSGWGERTRPPSDGIETHALHVALGADRPPASFAVNLTERADTSPLWQVSTVPEQFRAGALANCLRPGADEGPARGHLHLCLHYALQVPPGEARAVQLGAAVHLQRSRALANLAADLRTNAVEASRQAWSHWFGGVPYFACSDPYVQKAYWYRWYGLRLCTVDLADQGGAAAERYPYPCVYEGIGGFRSLISYSAQCHMREASWQADRALARGALESMLSAQENSGFIPGHIYLWRPDRGFYHANWGAGAAQVYAMTGDVDFAARIYPGLSRYAEYFERDRDHEDSHLYDIHDQGETGQEYMSRYLFVDDAADDWRSIRLKGVDATVYVYQLQRALAQMAVLLGKHDEAAVWDRKADATRDAVRARMWDPERGFFFDLDPRTGRLSPHKAAVGFYPFTCDIATAEHLPALTEHLLNPAEFWTPWPVPASSLDDPYFSAEGEWRGRRMSCPWNGRAWPMTNSHVCEGLARAALTLDPGLKPHAAELIRRAIRLLFHDQDPDRPNCFEHYNPLTGAPSAYRGIDDYQHSWVVDLICRYVAGVQPGPQGTLTLDPLPLPVERFALEGLRYQGRTIDVRWDAGTGYAVWVDGVERARLPERARLEVAL